MTELPSGDDHRVIHLGGEAAVVVRLEEYRRLRALERRATPEELADAEDEAALEDWRAREAAGQTSHLSSAEVRERLGFPQQ